MRSDATIARRLAEVAAGEQARLAAEVPVRLMLADDRLVLPLRHDRLITDGILIVHPCALLDALSALFELVWRDAVPFTLGTERPADAAVPIVDTTTRGVLSLLAAGLHDEDIARNLGCSHRTVTRHARHLADLVGAKTRFQAGLHVGRRGWTA